MLLAVVLLLTLGLMWWLLLLLLLLPLVGGESVFDEGDLDFDGEAARASSRRRRPAALAATGDPPMEEPLPEEPELDWGEAFLFAPKNKGKVKEPRKMVYATATPKTLYIVAVTVTAATHRPPISPSGQESLAR